jgi:hypothetical protein
MPTPTAQTAFPAVRPARGAVPTLSVALRSWVVVEGIAVQERVLILDLVLLLIIVLLA